MVEIKISMGTEYGEGRMGCQSREECSRYHGVKKQCVPICSAPTQVSEKKKLSKL